MDISERLSRVKFFDVKPDFSSLNQREKKAVSECVKATEVIHDIYLDQVYSGNRQILRELRQRDDPEGKNLLRYFLIQGSPWDSYNRDEPFIPEVGKRPEFGSFYPQNLTTEEWNKWLEDNPRDKDQFESPYTVIKRQGKRLCSVPYSEEYGEQLSEAANCLERAASCLPVGHLQTFLQMRAEAFRHNDYFESDMMWVDTNGNPFEVTIGPYEVYFDKLLGLKAAFESYVALPDKDSTKALQRFSPKVPQFDGILTEEFDFKPKGAAIPLEVVTDVIRGGEGLHTLFVAYNLPNDRRVHDLKGSKKVFSRTMMEAKFNTLLMPAAERLLPPRLLENCTFDNRLLFVLGHELAHGLGPSMIKVDGREMPFETALRDLHSPLEEAKADALGIRLLNFLRKENIIDDRTLEGILTTEIVGFVSRWNQGFKGAHSEGNLVEYNWVKAAGALRYDSKRKVYEMDTEKCIEALSELSTEFLKLQTAGDYNRAKAFMDQWGAIPLEAPEIIDRVAGIPTAVSPIYDLSELDEK